MIKKLCLALLLMIGGLASSAYASVNPKPFVIPNLQSWKGGVGEWTPTAHTRIVYPVNEPSLKQIAEDFARNYFQIFQQELPVVAGSPMRGDIFLKLSGSKKENREAYRIHIGNTVKVTAPYPIGVYWATMTLLQMSEQNKMLPQGKIYDYPDYPVRGLMLDVARKFIPLHYLESYIKMMSYYKMNTLQIHLNDNGFKEFYENDWNKVYAAFRLECDTYPGLTSDDGFYTKKEFINLQKFGLGHFVNIIPEIDVPAHSLAFTHYRPSLGNKKYGMDHLDLDNKDIYPFFDALFKEYLEGDNPVFMGKRVDIGTDEYSNENAKVVKQFREFTDHYIKFVEKYGKQACMWGALTHANGPTPVKSENVVMGLWNNTFAQPKEMIKQGYQLISMPDWSLYIVPEAGYYFNYLDGDNLYNTWTPAHIGKEVFKEKHPNILGGMFAVWNDHIGNGITNKDIYHRVFPAMQVLATKMWNTSDKLPFTDFVQKAALLSEAPGLNELAKMKNDEHLTVSDLKKNTVLPLDEVGYDYKVCFKIDGVKEEKGTVLTEYGDTKFYLSEPISGKVGFSREGYLYTFDYRIRPAEQHVICIMGNHKGVTMYVDDKKYEVEGPSTIYYKNGDKYSNMKIAKTLFFPLHKTGNFNSVIKDFIVSQKVSYIFKE